MDLNIKVTKPVVVLVVGITMAKVVLEVVLRRVLP